MFARSTQKLQINRRAKTNQLARLTSSNRTLLVEEKETTWLLLINPAYVYLHSFRFDEDSNERAENSLKKLGSCCWQKNISRKREIVSIFLSFFMRVSSQKLKKNLFSCLSSLDDLAFLPKENLLN